VVSTGTVTPDLNAPTKENPDMDNTLTPESLTPESLLAGIRETRLVAIVRGTDGTAAAKAALAAMEEGFRYVEIALTTPGALKAIREARAAAPAGCFVGAGTVLTAQDVGRVAEAGGQFMVTPALAESIDESARRGIPVLAGALTPSEAYEAMNRGATAVKLFPASIGGPGYLKALRDPFPGIPFIAVGGVGLDEAAGYWEAGAIAVGLGGPLFGDAGSGGDLTPVRERARSFVGRAADFGRRTVEAGSR
jgi:2-dehydro-3-deoxyphosphogluconate aldolase/(4S)-4-hydroxy-2-oxoglutarate aldolase